ncbi:hypothetical protein OsI_14666 [Oryza sativa Indica Group]|uniref:CCD97-like C-terminal domain-containing protein n=2 Tax=Oryza TaxID=4527 RepID=B8AUK7_ORYSI|nr:hypothetical protein OsI_14666 [Oryza sativa Indica Group]
MNPSIEVKDGISNMIFDLVAKKLIGFKPTKSRELRKNFQEFFHGMVSFPIYFPGTSFYRCMQGRRNVQKTLTDLLKERLSAPGEKYNDLIDQIIEELQSENPVIDVNFAIDVLSALLFASFATLSSTLAVGFKFLTDNPKVVKELKEEHTTILNKRGSLNSGFTWEEYKSLMFTSQVVNEITRISNVAPGIFRRTLADVKVNGYTIPAGWLVMISPMAVHLNPTLFEDPLEFNPWRWTDKTKQSELLRNYMPFGGGIRLCLGAEFSKLFIAIFIHVLVTEYRWKEIKGGDVLRISEMVDSNKTGGSPAGTSKQTLSAEEMDDQLEQFTSLMQQKFLSGEDFGHMDYSRIDNDEMLDDHWSKEANYDAGEKYFEED